MSLVPGPSLVMVWHKDDWEKQVNRARVFYVGQTQEISFGFGFQGLSRLFPATPSQTSEWSLAIPLTVSGPFTIEVRNPEAKDLALTPQPSGLQVYPSQCPFRTDFTSGSQ